jgi:PAS domain S-box-containing protein
MQRAQREGEGRGPAAGSIWPWLFSRAFASSEISLLLLDASSADQPIVFVSHGFERLTGYTREEAVGQGLALLEGSETDLSDAARLHEIVASGRPGRSLLRQQRKDGRAFWAALTLDPVRGAEGEFSHCLCVQLDATKQVETEEALRHSLNQIMVAKNDWEAALDSLSELVILVDDRMRVVRANRTVERWKLGDVRHVRGRDLHSLLHPRCFETGCYLARQWARLAAGESRGIDCNALDRQLSRRLQVTMRVVPGAQGGEHSSRVSIVLRDVGETVDEREVQRRRDRFEAMGYLVAGLAHEIGNPLAAMKTTLEVWSRNFDRFGRASHARYLTRLDQGVDRLRATVDRILGRKEQRASQAERAPLLDALERLRQLFEDEAHAKGLAFAVEVDPSVEPATCLTSDPAAVDEILANVTKNAIEASRAGVGVRIEASANECHVVVRVRDQGEGIRRDDMKNLFVPFFTTKPTGTGIGLAHANRLMEGMGGWIDVESMEGEGTLVTLRFQRAPKLPEP